MASVWRAAGLIAVLLMVHPLSASRVEIVERAEIAKSTGRGLKAAESVDFADTDAARHYYKDVQDCATDLLTKSAYSKCAVYCCKASDNSCGAYGKIEQARAQNVLVGEGKFRAWAFKYGAIKGAGFASFPNAKNAGVTNTGGVNYLSSPLQCFP